MSGKIIVFDGLDASGKETQSKLLTHRLVELGYNAIYIEFPRYNEKSSTIIKMYLQGELGDSADDVNPYAASCFYAIDRYVSFKTQWGKEYEKGAVIICDRYTSSNAIHQGSKQKESELEGYVKWLYEFEFHYIGIPKPDITFFLDVPVEKSIEIIKKRKSKNGGRDIHESDFDYLKKCYIAASKVSSLLGWERINCFEKETMRSRAQIHSEVLERVLKLL